MDGALYGSLEITLLYQFFGRGTRIRDGVQERHFILLISRLYLRKRGKTLMAQRVQASIARDGDEPWFDAYMWVKCG